VFCVFAGFINFPDKIFLCSFFFFDRYFVFVTKHLSPLQNKNIFVIYLSSAAKVVALFVNHAICDVSYFFSFYAQYGNTED